MKTCVQHNASLRCAREPKIRNRHKLPQHLHRSQRYTLGGAARGHESIVKLLLDAGEVGVNAQASAVIAEPNVSFAMLINFRPPLSLLNELFLPFQASCSLCASHHY
jgi:hypothetical protein